MDPLLQDKLLDLIVNVIAIILGGGLVTLFIEWRRHQREIQNWKREDETIQIDIPVSRLFRTRWLIGDKMSDKDKLVIYENQLEKTIREFIVYTEFVIRNTTPAEIIITGYSLEVPNIPFGSDTVDFYDSETFDPIEVDGVGAIRLNPYASIPRAAIYVAGFDKDRILQEPGLPRSATISVSTSSGKTIQQTTDLTLTNFQGLESYRGKYVPKKYYQRVNRDEEIPFEDDVPF